MGGSLYFFGSSMYIQAKAKVAQILLQYAWQKTLITQNQVKPWPSADFYPIAELIIPSTKTKMIVLNKSSGQALAFAPSHHEESVYPGKNGRTIVSMHRDTHGQFLKHLKKGDLITLSIKEGKELFYNVDEISIIDSSKLNLQINIPYHELILYSCYPLDAVMPGGSMRYVIQATLINKQKGKFYVQNRKYNSKFYPNYNL